MIELWEHRREHLTPAVCPGLGCGVGPWSAHILGGGGGFLEVAL